MSRTATQLIDALVAGDMTATEVAAQLVNHRWAPSPTYDEYAQDPEPADHNSWDAISTDPRLSADDYALLAEAYIASQSTPLVAKFNPNQPRDGDGKWSDGNITSDQPSAITQDDFRHDSSATTESVTDHAADKIAARLGDELTDDDVLAWAREERVDSDYFAGLSPSERKRTAVAAVLHEWRGSSGGPVAVAAITAVADDLNASYELAEYETGAQNYIRKNPQLNRFTQALGRAMYDLTQEWLAERNITELKLMRAGRGVDWDNSRPFTSWTLSWGGMRHEEGRVNREEVIPAARIMSVPSTGFGTLAESEVVVLPPVGDAVTAALAFKFNPNQPRDEDGQWTDGPDVDLPDVTPPSTSSKVGTKASGTGNAKPVVPAIIYKKHADGTVVAESSNERMRWDAGAKKFVVERRDGAGWQQTAQLTKTAAYEDTKRPGRWFEPGTAATPMATNPAVDRHNGGKNTSIIPPETPQPSPTVSAPTVETPEQVAESLGNGLRAISEKFGVDLGTVEITDSAGPAASMDLKTGTITANPAEVGRLDRFREIGVSLGGRLKLDVDVWTEAGVHEGGHALAHRYLTPEEQVDAIRAGAEAAGLPPPSDKASMVSSYGWSAEVEQTTQVSDQLGTGKISEAISPYAAFSMHETLAEALAEYVLVDEPRPFAKAVGDFTRSRLQPTVSAPTAETGEFTQRYDGPRFEFPDDVDQTVMDDFREKMAIDLFESRIVDERAQQLRMDNPDLFPGYSSYEKYKEVVRAELLAEGIISGNSSVDDALTTLYEAMSHISSYDDREAVRKRLHFEASVQAHLTGFANRHNLGPVTPKLKRELAKKLKNEFADKKIAMRVTPKNLEHILRDGRIKSQFETGKSKGMNNQLGRAEYERVMFGINPSITANVEKRPIYGYVAVDGVRPAAYHEGTLGGIGTDALSQYGQIQVIFKDQVRDRSTAMYGDSLNNGAFGLPSPINQPSWLSLTPMNHKSAITGNLDELERDPRDINLRSQIYVEAQIHNGVSTDDIAEVIFPSKPNAALQQSLADRGIPWRVLTLKSGAAESGELGETSRLYAQQQRDYALKRMAPLEERIVKNQADGHPPGYYEDSTKDLQRLQKLLKEADAALAVK